MASFDLLSLQPHRVSRDLTGYITYIYGAAKTGKTTLATQAGNALLFAFERGYNALLASSLSMLHLGVTLVRL
jgi:hypothetical protein